MKDIKLDRFDDMVLKALKENGELNLSELIRKANNRENRFVTIRRLKKLEDMDLIDFDVTNSRMSGYKIKLKDKNGRS